MNTSPDFRYRLVSKFSARMYMEAIVVTRTNRYLHLTSRNMADMKNMT